MNRLPLLLPMAIASAWLIVEGAWTYLSDYYFPATRPLGLSQMAAGILLAAPIILACTKPHPLVVWLAVTLSILVAAPPIWSSIAFANVHGWDVGGRNVAISLSFGALLVIACICIHRFVSARTVLREGHAGGA
jgi:hypothetical protein